METIQQVKEEIKQIKEELKKLKEKSRLIEEKFISAALECGCSRCTDMLRSGLFEYRE